MKTAHTICLAAGAALLTGCTGVDIARLNNAEPTGTEFTQQLTAEYTDLVNFEAVEMMDWPDAGRFADKGLRTSVGAAVPPERIEDWALPAESVAELTDARARLIKVLDGGSRDSFPVDAAVAQARFDCWIEQQEENHQPDHIAACRDEFILAMATIQSALPPPAPAPVYFVFFDFDGDELTTEARAIVDTIADDAPPGDGAPIAVTGHADRAGAGDYNLALSTRRATGVRAALESRGIAGDRIVVDGVGESDPLLPTADGVREPSNRRVEIRFQ